MFPTKANVIYEASEAEKVVKAFPVDKILRLIQEATTPQEKIMYILFAFGGRKPSECLHMFVEDFKLDRNQLKITFGHPVRSKINNQTSEEMYQEVLDSSTAKGRRSLVNLKKMCDTVEELGLDITIATLNREAQRLGIAPKEAAMRNNPRLWTYIIRRQEEQNLKEREVVSSPDLEELVKQLRAENNCLRVFISKMRINL